jgi:hypothetical protein
MSILDFGKEECQEIYENPVFLEDALKNEIF